MGQAFDRRNRPIALIIRTQSDDLVIFRRESLEQLGAKIWDKSKIVLVMDQLNTHTPGSLYEAFAPEEARRLADKLEIHHTPKHGSWLNMAEIELSVLARQCVNQSSTCTPAGRQRGAARTA